MEAPPGYSQEFKEGEGCKLKKGTLWLETVTKGLVWKIHQGNEEVWIQAEQLRSHFVPNESER